MSHDTLYDLSKVFKSPPWQNMFLREECEENVTQRAKLYAVKRQIELGMPSERAPKMTRNDVIIKTELQRGHFREIQNDKDMGVVITSFLGLPTVYSAASVTELKPGMHVTHRNVCTFLYIILSSTIRHASEEEIYSKCACIW
jgi:hypothetical protein